MTKVKARWLEEFRRSAFARNNQVMQEAEKR